VKDGKIQKREGPLPGEDEPLHAYITATDAGAIERGVKKVYLHMYMKVLHKNTCSMLMIKVLWVDLNCYNYVLKHVLCQNMFETNLS